MICNWISWAETKSKYCIVEINRYNQEHQATLVGKIQLLSDSVINLMRNIYLHKHRPG